VSATNARTAAGRGDRALVVSTHFPSDGAFVAGVHRRLDLLVEALAGAADELTALFLVRADAACSEAERRRHEARLRERWSARVSLRIAPVRQASGEASRWGRFLAGALDFRRTTRMDSLYNEDAREAVRSALLERPRMVLAHRLDAMSVLMRLPEETASARVVFDLDDVEHVATFRRLLRDPRWPTERLQLLHLPALMAGERRAVRGAAATLVCSLQDKRHLDRYLPGGAVHVVPNATRVADAPLPPSPERTVLFVGTFAYPPNVQAADELVRRVWPSVRARVPDAHLLVVGKDPQELASYATARSDPSITFTGFVEDLRACYARARVVCCPIRVGSGTRVKIIEAAGFGRPVVSTPLGAEGLALEDGPEIVLRQRDAELAAACADLLLAPGAAQRIGEAAWRRARTVYDRAAVVQRVRELFA
jgi:glycosyltransferase involved in cell wall biosynthesis